VFHISTQSSNDCTLVSLFSLLRRLEKRPSEIIQPTENHFYIASKKFIFSLTLFFENIKQNIMGQFVITVRNPFPNLQSWLYMIACTEILTLFFENIKQNIMGQFVTTVRNPFRTCNHGYT
jgi:hypothetical protein